MSSSNISNNTKQLEVKVIKALDLPRLDGNSRDPTAFVRVSIDTDEFGKEQKSTSVSMGKNANPSWRESLVFSSLPSAKSNRMLSIEVFNQDLFDGDQLLCQAKVSFDPSSSSSSTSEMEIPFSTSSNTRLYVQVFAKNPADCQHLLHEEPNLRKSASPASSPIQQQQQNQKPTNNDNNHNTTTSNIVSPSSASPAKKGTTTIKDLSEFPEDKRDALVKCFGIFDVDGNGTLSPSESLAAFLTFFPQMSAVKVRAKIQEADLNKDGNLDLNEFARIAIQFM